MKKKSSPILLSMIALLGLMGANSALAKIYLPSEYRTAQCSNISPSYSRTFYKSPGLGSNEHPWVPYIAFQGAERFLCMEQEPGKSCTWCTHTGIPVKRAFKYGICYGSSYAGLLYYDEQKGSVAHPWVAPSAFTGASTYPCMERNGRNCVTCYP